MKQEGQTLMELMIVIVIIGILATLGLPNFLGLQSRVHLRSVAEEIASELRLARQLAISHRDRVRVVFDAGQQVLEAQFVDDPTIHHVYRYGDKGIMIEEPSAGPQILFHPSGRSATATTMSIRSSEGQVQKLTVAITGRVSIL